MQVFFLLAIRVLVDNELSTCVAGGVEIIGLHATVAPRRQQTQAAPITEKYTFVPYRQMELGKTDCSLQQYAKLCTKYIKHRMDALLDNGIADKIPNRELFQKVLEQSESCDGVQSEVEQYLIKEKNQYSLLNLIHDVFGLQSDDNFLQKAKTVIEEGRDKLSQDRLLSFMLHPERLKPCLDLALENGKRTKVKVVEFCCRGCSPIYPHVISLLQTQPMLNVEYVLTGPGAAGISDDVPEKYGIRMVPWDGSLDPPHNMVADILVIRNVYVSSVSGLLRNLVGVLAEGGFLLLQEPTTNFSIPLFLGGLTNDLSADDSQGLFNDSAHWEKYLQDLELNVISLLADGILYNTFLCQKQKDVPKNPPVIDVSDVHFSWIEELKVAMINQEKAVDNGRIWLRVQAESPSGVIGLVNCLRQEPGGAGIRSDLLLNACLGTLL